MYSELKNRLIHRRAVRKWNEMQQQALFGEGFCTSPMYPDRLLHLYYNVHLKGVTDNRERTRFGDYCNVSLTLTLLGDGRFEAGDYVYMNSHCRFYIANTLRIGSHCLFGPNITVWDSDNHPLDPAERIRQAESIPHKVLGTYRHGGGNITIGPAVWIGMNALILGGVTIGKGSVIAAGSVVTQDIPEMVLAGGVPARPLKSLEEK